MYPDDSDYIPAHEATARLGISTATLYAYVSRGLVESRPGEDHRSRLYRLRDVERLAARKRAGRGAARGAAQSLDRGLPVMETAISLIRPEGPYYRGRSAIALARDGASLEDAARLLWECGDHDPFATPPPAWPATAVDLATNLALPPLERALATMPLLALGSPQSLHAGAAVRRGTAALLLRQNAALLAGTAPSAEPVHALLAHRWRPGDAAFADLLRRALVLCADHELNVSAFAARVVASTGAHLHATVCAGLSALTGPRHGGATARALAFLREAHQADDLAAWVGERWRRGDDLPGFGHALYPDGDPRGAAVLAALRALPTPPPRLDATLRVIDEVEAASGQRPNIDLMLAAIVEHHGLDAPAALALFAAGRVAGWLAHALEQQTQGGLIRPRARYIGAEPAG
ncbi:citrate synthase [Dokdonella sp. MW10]|uniref:citrate synthase n=1 Tax=Dokdonella sp. MW10 TaxID=2992926 RepID=UPI003F7F5680